MRSTDAEVVIVGGGIAGASAAFHLAALGHRVTLLERGEIASGASGVNAGQIDSVGWGHAPDLQAHLTAGSVELFQQVQVDHGFSIEFRRSGGLQAIATPEHSDFARHRVATLRARGHEIELLDAREARSLEPALNPSVLGAMYSPRRSQADPVLATRAWSHLAERHGARILTGHEVTAIEPKPTGGFVVQTEQLQVVAPSLVIAAGAWSGAIGAMLEIEIPVVPVHGQMWATRSLPPRVFQTISSVESTLAWDRERRTMPASGRDDGEPPDLTLREGVRVTRHLYGRQRQNGEVIFGGDRQLAGWSATIVPAGIDVNRSHAAEICPFLASVPTDRTWAGLMPFTLDGKPLIGRIPNRDGLWIVTGLASSGFGRGPMAGKLLADALHAGTSSPILDEADPARCVREAARG
ncbi:MAG TPA: FAD-dependent oxidoreductase [Candidatus Methylomirabilis sp.]|nr:FAD-dependent oxidoreductase [Candidatus Methylomirabilis sp.]